MIARSQALAWERTASEAPPPESAELGRTTYRRNLSCS